MAEAGDEHSVVDWSGDRVSAAGQQCGSDRAFVALERQSNARIDRVAQTLHECSVAERQPTAFRRLDRLDAAHHETGCANALEIHIAAEIVAARPHWRERRLQPRLQFDKAADCGRRALSHRQPNAFHPDLRLRAVHVSDAQHKAISTLAYVARFDKARKRHRKHWPGQHAMRDPRRLPRRCCKTRGHRRDHHHNWKYPFPPKQERRSAKRRRGGPGHAQNRLMIRGEVECDSGTEGDWHPRQQPPGSSFRADPFAHLLEDGGPGAEAGWCDGQPRWQSYDSALSRSAILVALALL